MLKLHYQNGNEKRKENSIAEVKILFKNKNTEKQFSSKYKKNWRYPEMVKTKLESVENFILRAGSLMDIANFPPFHFERLKGTRKNEWSIRVGNTGYRVTMIPCNDDEEEIVEGDILAKCRIIKIVKITEVSNHYE